MLGMRGHPWWRVAREKGGQRVERAAIMAGEPGWQRGA